MDFLGILYFTILALHVSGAIFTHHHVHKLQSTAVGTRNFYGVGRWIVDCSKFRLGHPHTHSTVNF
jgi:hypothetical protein